MPTPHHDAIVETFRMDAGVGSPGMCLRSGEERGHSGVDPSVRQLGNTEHRVNALLHVGRKASGAVIVVEVQRRRVNGKRRRWPRCVGALWDDHGVPVCLLVVATSGRSPAGHVVHQRGWRVAPAQKRRVEACRDPGKLAAWVKRIMTSPTLDDALAV